MTDTAIRPSATAPALAFIKIVVRDLDRAMRFYCAVLARRVTSTYERPGLIEKILAAPEGDGGPSIVLYHATSGDEIDIGNGWAEA